MRSYSRLKKASVLTNILNDWNPNILSRAIDLNDSDPSRLTFEIPSVGKFIILDKEGSYSFKFTPSFSDDDPTEYYYLSKNELLVYVSKLAMS